MALVYRSHIREEPLEVVKGSRRTTKNNRCRINWGRSDPSSPLARASRVRSAAFDEIAQDARETMYLP